MAILALLLSAGILAGCAYLPTLLHRRPFGWQSCGWVLVPFLLLWLGAAAGFEKPGLFVGFTAFRLLALCGAALWLGLTLCALRCYGVLGGAKRLASLLAALLFAALGTEIFVCNLPYFATHGYTPVNLLDYLDEGSDAQRLADGSVRVTEEQGTLYFTGMDAPLYDLQLGGLSFNYEGAQPAAVQNPLMVITITATDAASSQENASWAWPVAWRAPRSWVRTLDLAGDVHSLRLVCAPYSGEYMWYQGDYTIASVTANAPRALDFSLARLGVLWLLWLAVWALRPGSGLWRTPYLQGRKSHRLASAAICALLMSAAVATPFASPIDSGVATATYNANNWDGGSRLSFSQHINDYQHSSGSQYGSLAHSLLNGRLDLMLDPPEALLAMENPLDTALRSQQAPDALWDVALYNGRYYVYFGVVPCLLFQLPLEALTGVQDWPPCFGMIAMAVLMLLAIFAGLKQALRRWFPGASTAAYLLGCVGIAAGSGMYYLLLRAAVYDYAILCGASFVCLALWQWLHAANLVDAAVVAEGEGNKPKTAGIRLHLALGSLCMALVAGCRPQLVVFAVLALPLFWGQYIAKGRLRSKNGLWEALCFILPVVVVAAGLMWYNAARFGSPFDFGANYNLTSNDMTKRGFRTGRIGPALFAAFMLPPALRAVFPYVSDIRLATNLIGTNITELYYGGLLWMSPLLGGLCLLPFLAKRLRKNACLPFVLCCVAAAPFMVILDAEMAGVLYRYQTDFSPVLLLGGVLCLLCAEQALQQRCSLPGDDDNLLLLRRDSKRLQTLLHLGFALSVAIGCCLAFCVVFGTEPWLYSQSPALFQNVSRLVQFWL